MTSRTSRAGTGLIEEGFRNFVWNHRPRAWTPLLYNYNTFLAATQRLVGYTFVCGGSWARGRSICSQFPSTVADARAQRDETTHQTFHPKFKIFQNSLSHWIFRHVHGVLNIDENKNKLYSLVEIYETNLLSLVSLWLDNICYIQTKGYCSNFVKKFPSK